MYLILTEQMTKDAKRLKVDEESGNENPILIVIISKALVSFFFTDEKKMLQAEVLG